MVLSNYPIGLVCVILFQSLFPDGPRDEMCSGRERPAHTVQITKGFWMGQTETTLAAYDESLMVDPKGPAAGEKRSLRGGSWYDDNGNARASFRGFDNPRAGFLSVGFRCVRDSEP